MENASKALIIAGAILLSIAIIGVGMYVYNNVSSTIQKGADMSTQEIAAYNQEFTIYEGAKVRGANVKTLCDKVNNHNLAADDASELIVLEYDKEVATEVAAPTADDAAGTKASDINTVKTKILSGQTYKVTIGKDPNTGLVSAIGIKLAN